MKSPRVFVVQQPAFYDRTATPPRFVPKYDLTPASQHGALVFLLGPGNIFRDRMEQAQNQLSWMLRSFTEDDYLLAVGDPVAIAAAVLIAGERTGGVINLLKWNRRSAAYEPFTVSCVG